MSNDFRTDIEIFIKKSENADAKGIKKMYYQLVKKYHPDINSSENSSAKNLNDYMMSLNHIYYLIKNKQTENITFTSKEMSDLQKNAQKSVQKSNEEKLKDASGKYQFKNRFNKIEKVSNKSLYFYKMGLDRIFWARDYLCEHPMGMGYGDEIVFKVSQELFKAIKYLNISIKVEDDNSWNDEAVDKIKWAYQINNRITKTLLNTESKELTC